MHFLIISNLVLLTHYNLGYDVSFIYKRSVEICSQQARENFIQMLSELLEQGIHNAHFPYFRGFGFYFGFGFSFG